MKEASAAAVIARALGETTDEARERISAIVEALGEGACMVLLDRTFETEEGMILLDPSTPRDRAIQVRPSGEFFRLAERALPASRHRAQDEHSAQDEQTAQVREEDDRPKPRVLRGPQTPWEGRKKPQHKPERNPDSEPPASLSELTDGDVLRALFDKFSGRNSS